MTRKDTWNRTWRFLNLDENNMEIEYESLRRAYQEGGRSYHDFTHVDYMLRFILSPEGRFAAFYHDIFQEKGLPSGENEKNSATRAYNVIRNNGGSLWSAIETKHAIEATAHDGTARTPISEEVCDADLAILASTAEEYEEYMFDIRCEYKEYSDEDYASGRIAFLRSMLAKRRVYYTHIEWEEIARGNMEREISFL